MYTFHLTLNHANFCKLGPNRLIRGIFIQYIPTDLGKTHKFIFLMVGPLRFPPSHPNCLVVHDTFFYLFLVLYSLIRQFFCLQFFLAKRARFFFDKYCLLASKNIHRQTLMYTRKVWTKMSYFVK